MEGEREHITRSHWSMFLTRGQLTITLQSKSHRLVTRASSNLIEHPDSEHSNSSKCMHISDLHISTLVWLENRMGVEDEKSFDPEMVDLEPSAALLSQKSFDPGVDDDVWKWMGLAELLVA
eukprot:56447-Rhodomonas_salina.1